MRNRQMVGVTLSKEARDALDALAADREVTRSALVETLIFKAAGLDARAASYPGRARSAEAPPKKRTARKKKR